MNKVTQQWVVSLDCLAGCGLSSTDEVLWSTNHVILYSVYIQFGVLLQYKLFIARQMLICWQWDLASKQHATNRWELGFIWYPFDLFFFSQKLQMEKNYTAEIYLKKNNIKTRRCTTQWRKESTTKAPELSEGSSTLDFSCIVFSLCNLWLTKLDRHQIKPMHACMGSLYVQMWRLWLYQSKEFL